MATLIFDVVMYRPKMKEQHVLEIKTIDYEGVFDVAMEEIYFWT